MLIPGYPAGSDITLLDVQYQGPLKNKDGKYSKTFLNILFKDNITGEKKFHTIVQPKYTFYMLKEDHNVDIRYNNKRVPEDQVFPITVEYKNVIQEIAKRLGRLDEFYDNIRSGRSSANSIFLKDPHVFRADMNIMDYYRLLFHKEYKNTPIPLSKAFFDIEVDIINCTEKFVELGAEPIILASLYHRFSNTIYAFILENPNNPSFVEFKKSFGEIYLNEVKDFIKKHMGEDKYHKYGFDDMSIKAAFFNQDKEADFIITLVNLIRRLNPDFLMAWNISFDIPYIIERAKKLNIDIQSLFSDDIPREYSLCKYYIDNEKFSEFAERGDYIMTTLKTVCLDSLINYAGIRKGRKAPPDFKLDTIAQLEVGFKKLDYTQYSSNLKYLPYKNFDIFFKYNLIDTLSEACIELKTNDVDFTFNKALVTFSRYNKCHRQSVYLKNRATQIWGDEGYIIGNNTNFDNTKDNIPGAIVADPLNVSVYGKEKLCGIPINVIKDLIDFDFKALYPSINREFNESDETQVGKIYIDDKVWKDENRLGMKSYDRGGQYLEDYRSGNYIDFSKRWLGLGGVMDIIQDIHEFINQYTPGYKFGQLQYSPFYIDKRENPTRVNAIEFVQNIQPVPALQFFDERPDMEELAKDIEKFAQYDLDDIDTIRRRLAFADEELDDKEDSEHDF